MLKITPSPGAKPADDLEEQKIGREQKELALFSKEATELHTQLREMSQEKSKKKFQKDFQETMAKYWSTLKEWSARFHNLQQRGVAAAQEISKELIKIKASAGGPGGGQKETQSSEYFSSTGHTYRDHIIKGIQDLHRELNHMHLSGTSSLEDQVKQLKKDVIFKVESLQIQDIKTSKGGESKLQKEIKKYLQICEGKLKKLNAMNRELEPSENINETKQFLDLEKEVGEVRAQWKL